jgi:hypothetical protein
MGGRWLPELIDRILFIQQSMVDVIAELCLLGS